MESEIMKKILNKHKIIGKNIDILFVKNLNNFSVLELKKFLKSIGAQVSGSKEKLIERIKNWNKTKKIIYSFLFILPIIGILGRNIIKQKILKIIHSLNDKIIETILKVYFNESGLEKIKKVLKLFLNSDGIDIIIDFLKDLHKKDDSFHETITFINEIMTEKGIPYIERIKFSKKIIHICIKNKNYPTNIIEDISKDEKLFSFFKKIFI